MNKISFAITANKYSNDHETRVIIDGNDWLGDSQMGIDPPELFKQLREFETGFLLIGRCECGCVGCDDVFVKVSRDNNHVQWEAPEFPTLKFNKIEYDEKITNLINDNSWEDINRRVERLISKQFTGMMTDDGLSFNWASARIKENIIHLSFSKDLEQRLLEFSWDGITEETALKQASIYKRERFEN